MTAHNTPDKASTVFWNVDTQYDFMRPDGKLYVSGAEGIEGNLERITLLAASKGIKVINTADWHTEASREISSTPDYMSTFPPHCMRNTPGAEYVPATAPLDAYTIDWDAKSIDAERITASRNIIIRKDEFDAFHPTGAPHTAEVLDIIKPAHAIVYGVATNVCDDYAVMGLLRKGIEVTVIKDAIKELPNMPVQPVYDRWLAAGARFVKTEELESMIDAYEVGR